MLHPRFQTTRTDVILESDDPDALALESPVDVITHQVGGRTFVYLANRVSDDIGIYELFGDGTITQHAPNQTTSNTDAGFAVTVVDVGGVSYLYHVGENLDIFRITDTGLLTLVQSIVTPPVLSDSQVPPDFIVIDGTTFMVARSFGGEIITHAINPDGTLGAQTERLTVDADTLGLDDNFLRNITVTTVGETAVVYVLTFENAVIAYDMASDGSLSNERLVASFTGSPRGGFEVTQIDGSSYLTFCTTDGEFLSFALAPDGSLTSAGSLALADVYANGIFVQDFDVIQTDDGRALFLAANNTGEYALIEIGADGQLSLIQTITGVDGGIDDNWSATSSVLIDGTIFTVIGNTEVDGLGVYKTTTGDDFVTVDEDVSIPTRFLKPSDTFEMRLPVLNDGDVGGSQVTVTFILSDDNAPSLEDRVLGSSFSLVLAPGDLDDYSYSFGDGGLQIPADTDVGTYFIYAELDIANDVAERNDTNNTSPLIKIEIGYFTDGTDTVTLDADKGGAGTLHRAFAGNDTVTVEASGITVDGGSGKDMITIAAGARNVQAGGGKGNDVVFGAGTADRLTGGSGNDVIKGKSANDWINGGSGKDTVDGGKGADDILGGASSDRLTGGNGDDWFIFNTRADSKAGSKTRDTITDFERGKDAIDLSGLDGNIDRPRDQNLTFLGKDGFSGSGDQGEVRWIKKGDDLRVAIDLNADGRVDMEIQLLDLAKLSASDFIL